MIPLPLDVTRLADLTFLQKARLPVSAAVDTAGSPVVISRYEDDVWNFWPYISRENAKDGEKRIIWGIALPDGSRLTDEAHRSLLPRPRISFGRFMSIPSRAGKRLGLKDTDLPDGQPSVSAALDGQSRHHQVCPVGWQNPGVRSGSQGWKVRQKYRDEEVAPGREVVCAGGEDR
ncbi:hypothetical protein [Pseudomonas aeruginosa]|uniref:hypothetical protein n=1 Tax=Pseudomonas aeruginosa TaxID=287 RepID=UPI0013DE501F|nr:hypothetical protein [Pseudomonas aeruginosa]